jgi:hypothetical protein
MVEDSAKKNRADSKKGIPNGNTPPQLKYTVKVKINHVSLRETRC